MTRRLWDGFVDGEDVENLAADCHTARDWFYLAVLAFARGRDEAAATYAATAAAQHPDSRLYRAASTYLARVGKSGRQRVYTQPEGFAAFIRGGGNVTMYAALSAALRDRYDQYRPVRLLDVGVGDGLALLPALDGSAVTDVDLLEPSTALLDSTGQALSQRGIAHRSANATVQQLARGVDAWPPDTRWELAQSTFALHNVERAERLEVLTWLRRHAARLLIAEFDLTPGRSCEPEWFDYVATRYERGLAEYDADGDTVAQGFLMPIMFGYFDPDTVHHEQSIADWLSDLAAAGFTDQRPPQPLSDYWWAPSFLLDVG
ncbi:MAG TPA: class I SAM-dependent methyltransferase [Stackebrandtia sp.]|uniref:class I SAM-dependent methyltransferase n=1 Tax=Stackebrandtia sp. TaxID=2023065 RepID=UPI002D53189A|nr:class I SAM-dependent methyltransferase [Stackebrandtia sp.]HZE38984.1 class I SAM-dependent methyltransferase [Stackebrandtia sp.]